MNPITIFKVVSVVCFIGTVSCANPLTRSPRQVAPSAQSSSASAADAAAKAAAHQAKLHYVEIGPSLKGDYKFGYDTGSGPAGQSFREETRLDDGTVKGAYGYVDANGKQRIVKYTAGKGGFVVENDQEAPGQGGGSAAQAAANQPRAPEPTELRRPQPVSLPQAPAQPSFDEQPPSFNLNRANPQLAAQQQQQLPTAEDRARAEREHAEGLRQHQLAQQAALAQQQKLAQQLHLQQQQILASQAARPQPQQQLQQQQQQPQQHQPIPFSPQQQFPPQASFQQPQQAPHHQVVDPQSGSFFSSSTDSNLNQLLSNQLRQLQSGNQFAGQFQQQQNQFPSAQQPQDFSQFRGARQVAPVHPQQQHQQQHQPQHFPQPQQANAHGGAQSVLAALHQQQQQDAQMLAQLRAQHLARLQEQARQAPQQQVRAPEQFQQQAPAPAPIQVQPQAQVQPQQQAFAQRAAAPVNPQQQALAQPQPESFGPPVIDIRTLNYSIGMQTRV